MSYAHALGQYGKYVPGQVNFLDSRRGRTPGWQRWEESMAPMPLFGLGQLTATLCDPTTTAGVFQTRLTDALNAGSQAALVGGAIAGVVGAIVGKRSLLLGAVGGAATAWGANLVWTATHRA